MNSTNYHSLQAQATLRPTHGLNFTTTYTWSKNLGIKADGSQYGVAWTDPLNRGADYGILGGDRRHALTSYGTYNLPFGPNGYVLRDSQGWVRKLAEGWQLSWVYSASSGQPYSVATVNSMWGGSGVDLVNPDLFDPADGHVDWGWTDPSATPGSAAAYRVGGKYFGNKYVQVADPQCAGVVASLAGSCNQSLKALALASDPSQIVFQHAAPGVKGNFDTNLLTSPGRWSLDMAASKNIEISEGKAINFRVDVANILNHATPSGSAPFTYDQRTYAPGNPTSNISTATSGEPFGYLGYKVGHRVLSVKMRVSF